MRFGPHWSGYPPDDPPQGDHWCSECSAWDDDCVCDPEEEVLEPFDDCKGRD